MNVLVSVVAAALTFFLVSKGRRNTVVTASLISTNILVYLMFSDGITTYSWFIYRWGDSLMNVLNGNPWVLVTACFIHVNVVHILMNMYALYIFGEVLEPHLGGWKFFTLYMVAGIVGNIFSSLLDPFSVGVGASGAILGLFGYLIAYEYKMSGRISVSSALIAIFVIAGGFMPDVDILAHLGGFLTGAICGVVSMRRTTRSYQVAYYYSYE